MKTIRVKPNLWINPELVAEVALLRSAGPDDSWTLVATMSHGEQVTIVTGIGEYSANASVGKVLDMLAGL